jgi:uncharacterized protein YjbI with pentapeptide repeats
VTSNGGGSAASKTKNERWWSRWKWALWPAVVILVGGVIYLLVWYVPDVLVRHKVDTSVESAWISAVATLLGVGATAAVAIFAFWYASSTNKATLEAANENLRDQREQLHQLFAEQREQLGMTFAEQREQLDRQLAAQQDQLDKTLAEQRARTLNERFATAAGQLGNDKPAAVRLAGVYAMAGLADDWRENQQNQQTCIDVLCGFLRLLYDPNPSKGTDPNAQSADLRSREVWHTVVRVIAAHLRAGAAVSWQGLDFDFTGVDFDGGDFRGAVFSGEVSFRGAVFSSGTVDFSDAEFTGGTVDFSDAEFTGGTVDFTGAKFSGGTVSFNGVGFPSGEVHFDGAKFSAGTVDFNGARFVGGEVHFDGADFSGSTVTFDRAKFSGGTVDFNFAKFSGGTVNFTGALFTGGTVDFNLAKFSGGTVNFNDVEFPGVVHFVSAEFPGGTVTFHDASFGEVYFGETPVGFFDGYSGLIVGFVGADFSGGTVVSFNGAVFAPGVVTFRDAVFSGGTVDFSHPRRWIPPPVFPWPGKPPPGVKLPSESESDNPYWPG